MRARFILPMLAALALLVPRAAAETASIQSLTSTIAGLMTDGRVVAGAIPLASGRWGTDYITVSHALSMKHEYAVVRGGDAAAAAKPVMACSSMAHGIDVLVLRVVSHKELPVLEWGDPIDLRSGDELMVMVRKEFHPEPVKVKFLHLNLLQWARAKPGEWPAQWHNVMVAHGLAKPGFSGSPWIKQGKIYGLLKGAVRPPGHAAWYATAETATRIKQCLKDQHYDDMVAQAQQEEELLPNR